ncbi:MAG: carbamoyltransferase HypF [Desulfobacteraceae bacterium]
MEEPVTARQVEISGIVQGVGFRPFLFQLAHRHSIAGEVSNTPSGVMVFIEGDAAQVEAFVRDIPERAPKLASITDISVRNTEPEGFKSFKIAGSRQGASKSTLISPDVSVCAECLEEMNDPGNRRYQYPFINCTNCGPRFTIIEDIPYDRPKTSMKHFPMCGQCRKEYEDPLDRRFHAQPNACHVCGPQAFLLDPEGTDTCRDGENPLDRAAELLTEGYILAVKGLGGFHLAVDASDERAVQKLRQLKQRPHKPLAVMAGSVDRILPYVHVDEEESRILESFHRPIVLLDKRKNPGESPAPAPSVAPDNPCLGVMLPYTPLHFLLLEKGPPVLVMTSGNRTGEPLSIDNEDALDAFGDLADYFLVHNRDICFRADDSIVRVMAGEKRFLRRSRGYTPLPVFLKNPMPRVLACGGGLKSTVCITRENQAVLSQHIGDLDNEKVYDFYNKSVDHLKTIFDTEPEIIAHDMHPGYMSTDYAVNCEGLEKAAVQHHHAHAVSCMAEHGLESGVVAVTLDGTGYGTDGRIWGGEILVCSTAGFERKAHLEYIPMPGGDAAVKEPWRMAAAWLARVFGTGFCDLDIPVVSGIEREKLLFVKQMVDKGLNSPLTSSTGRLFDAVSSMLGIRHTVTFESQAAMELENAANGISCETVYPYEIDDGLSDGPLIIRAAPMIKAVVKDLLETRDTGRISADFHATVVEMFVTAAVRVCTETGINNVVLSGGVFCNALVFERMISRLENHGLNVYTHTKVPCGDGGISLGQAVVAGTMKRSG